MIIYDSCGRYDMRTLETHSMMRARMEKPQRAVASSSNYAVLNSYPHSRYLILPREPQPSIPSSQPELTMPIASQTATSFPDAAHSAYRSLEALPAHLDERPEDRGRLVITIVCSAGERYLSTAPADAARKQVWS